MHAILDIRGGKYIVVLLHVDGVVKPKIVL